MTIPHLGEYAALSTAILWTITALIFESASKRVGSMVVNFYKLAIAGILLSVFTFFTRGLFFPYDASLHAWVWLSASGIIGFVFGDIFLFQSYLLIGSRMALLVMSTVPILTTGISLIFLDESLKFVHLAGIITISSGIAIAVVRSPQGENKPVLLRNSKGFFYAFLGALGQAGGLVLSKYGMVDYNPFAATQIRTFAALSCFLLFFLNATFRKQSVSALYNRKACIRIFFGSIFGPFLGVSLSLLAVQHCQTGIAAAIMSVMPILIIPPAVLFNKEKVIVTEVIGALMSVIGTALLFIYPSKL